MKVLCLTPKQSVCWGFPDFDSIEMTNDSKLLEVFIDVQFLIAPRSVEKQAVWEWYFLTMKWLIKYVSLIMKERGAHWREKVQWEAM